VAKAACSAGKVLIAASARADSRPSTSTSVPGLGLLRAFWIRGETALETATPEAGALYPELAFETIESAFVAMAGTSGQRN
jgi:hypothetical protein